MMISPAISDQRAFDGGGEEFGLSMPVGVVHVAGFGGHVQAIEPDEAGDDVDRAFQGVGENGYGMGKVIGDHFRGKG